MELAFAVAGAWALLGIAAAVSRWRALRDAEALLRHELRFEGMTDQEGDR